MLLIKLGLVGGDAKKQGLLDKTTKEYETSEEAFNEALIRELSKSLSKLCLRPCL